MPVDNSDTRVRLSTQSGAAGNTTASTPAESIGGFISTTDLVDASLANLFPEVPLAIALPGGDVYRCVFVTHVNGTSTWQAVRVWIASQEAGGGDVTVGLDPAGVVPIGQAGAQAAVIADQQTAPAGVTFAAPSSYPDGLEIGTIAPGECAAVWVRARFPANPDAKKLDQAVLSASGPSE